MITNVAQRWRERRGVYRPAGEVIKLDRYDVRRLWSEEEAKAFVEFHHYAHSWVAARYMFGLYRDDVLVGVCVFSHPMNNAALTNFFPGEANDSVELGRLVLLDDVPANGESWFVAECFARLRKIGLLGVLSFSDPIPRHNAAGALVFRGHIGNVYQALGATYAGRGTARTLRMFPDGRVLIARSASKVRGQERSADHVEKLLIENGAKPMGRRTDPAKWLKLWTERLTRPVRHPGNHRYLWILPKNDRKYLPPPQPYPKMILTP